MAGDYLGLPNLISLILLIIPVTAWLLGALTRFKDGAYLAGLLRLVLGWNLFWILDIIFTLISGCQVTVWRILPC